MNTTIEEELAFTRQYIRANQLDMDSDTISTLLKIKFNADCDLFDRALQVPTLLLLADSPEGLLEYKRAKVERHRHQTKIKSCFIANTSHDFHTEKPKEIAKAIHDFLSNDV
ncbi:alpha/beta hydrolase [Facklamia hominis]|uniref:alpha/beta fold hydrolase n=1 Tax=Facklamia hominis TaxID=178214 RepID=UPI0029D40F15|nr:alpha/beta hydrolase [Facklamia hominis]WPJ90302.1 alpha/beta hydrolase [Facklamia hominis]